MNLKNKIKEIIIDQLGLSISANDISDEDYLLAGGLNIDSISMIEIIVRLETEYDISFSDEEMTIETFINILSIEELVLKKLD